MLREEKESSKLILEDSKGSVVDGIGWIIILLVLGLMVPIGMQITSGINTQFQGLDDNLVNHSQSKNIMGSLNNDYPSLFDGIFFMIFIGIVLVSIVLALSIKTNPAFFFISIIAIVIIIILAGIFANVYATYAESAQVAQFEDDFPIMNFIFDNLVFMIVVLIGILAVVIWAKT